MNWLTYHRPLGTGAEIKLPLISPHPVVTLKFVNVLRGVDQRVTVTFHPGDKDEEPSFFCNLPDITCDW